MPTPDTPTSPPPRAQETAREFMDRQPWVHKRLPIEYVADLVAAIEQRDAETRRAAMEDAAKIADAHQDAAQRLRRAKFPKALKYASEELQTEIVAEERGEKIAAEIIARNIRAAASPASTAKGK